MEEEKKENKKSREVKETNTKDNKKKPDILMIVLIIILVALICFLVGYKIKNINVLANNNKKVKELHEYFSTDNLGNCEGLFNYSTDKVTFEEVSDSAKLCIAYFKSSQDDKMAEITYEGEKTCEEDDMVFKTDTDDGTVCTVNKIKQNVIDDTYKKIFGRDISNNETFKYDGKHICYLKDGYYYCGLSEKMKITLSNDVTVFRSIIKAEKKDDKIILYDYFTKVSNDVCYLNYTTLNTNQACTNNLPKKIDDIDYDFIKKYGVQYKHIYQKAKDDTYYWVSSEPVQNPEEGKK